MRCRAFSIAVAVLLAVPCAAAEGPRVTVEAGEGPVTVGDPFPVSVEVPAAAGTPVLFPALGGSWGKLGVLEERTPTVRRTPEGEISTRIYVLAAFEPGVLELPPLEILVGVGDDASTVETPPTRVQVESVLQEGETELADIKPPAFLPMALRWLPWLLAAVALAAVGLALWWWRRRRRAQAAEAGAVAPPPLPPAEEALAALDRLLAARMLEEGRIKEFHVVLSEIAKRYLWRRFDVPTVERTTFEVLRDARAVPLEGWVCDRASSILNACDAVKFARRRPATSRCRASAEEARDLVLRTRPLAAAPETEAPADAAAEG